MEALNPLLEDSMQHWSLWYTPSATLMVVSHELTDEFLEPRIRLVLIPRALVLFQKNLNLLDYFSHIPVQSLTFFFIVLSSSSFLYSWYSIKITSLQMTILWVVGSHRRYPFTPSVYSKKIHLLDFVSSFVLSWALYITYTGHPNICR